MRSKILLVEDEKPLSTLLVYNLESEGFEVLVEDRGDDAELHLRETIPDLLILDWMLPGVSGIELCRRLRQAPATKALPIIMLTARGEESERIRGLATGADDYMVKPFSVAELMARVKALLRRANPSIATDLMELGDVRIDRNSRRAFRGVRELKLGPTEFRLLEFLMRSPGRVYGRDQLLDHVWGRDAEIDDRTVDVHVGRLRKAVTMNNEVDPIRTVRGSGYSFDETFVKKITKLRAVSM
jgi:two-component system, OmpR family, phosphate regulon response regulator PhoB